MRGVVTLQRGVIFLLATAATAAVGVWTVDHALPAVSDSARVGLLIQRETPLTGKQVRTIVTKWQSPTTLERACKRAKLDPYDPIVEDTLATMNVQEAPGGVEMAVDVGPGRDPAQAARLLEELWRVAAPAVATTPATNDDSVQRAELRSDQAREDLKRAANRFRAFVAELAKAPPVSVVASPSVTPTPLPSAPANSEVERRIAALERERHELLGKFKPAHPSIKNLDHEIKAARAELARGVQPASPPASGPSMTVETGPADGSTALQGLAAAEKQLEAAVAEVTNSQQAERLARGMASSPTPAAGDRMLATIERSGPPPRPLALAIIGVLSFLVGLAAAWALPGGGARVYREVEDVERDLNLPVLTVMPPDQAQAA